MIKAHMQNILLPCNIPQVEDTFANGHLYLLFVFKWGHCIGTEDKNSPWP